MALLTMTPAPLGCTKALLADTFWGALVPASPPTVGLVFGMEVTEPSDERNTEPGCPLSLISGSASATY